MTTDGFEAVYELNRQEIGYLLERLGVDAEHLPVDTRSVRVALDGGLKVSVDRGVWTLPLGTWYQ